MLLKVSEVSAPETSENPFFAIQISDRARQRQNSSSRGKYSLEVVQ